MRVECYSGYRAEERPLRFTLGNLMHEVIAIEGQWYSPGVSWFRVRADDGDVYVLRHDDAQDVWTLDALRAEAASGP